MRTLYLSGVIARALQKYSNRLPVAKAKAIKSCKQVSATIVMINASHIWNTAIKMTTLGIVTFSTADTKIAQPMSLPF